MRGQPVLFTFLMEIMFFCTSLMKNDSVSRLRPRRSFRENASRIRSKIHLAVIFFSPPRCWHAAAPQKSDSPTFHHSFLHRVESTRKNESERERERRCVCFNKFPSAQLWPGRKETSALLHSIFLWTYLRPPAHPTTRLATPRGDNLCMKYTAEPLY